MCLVFFYLGFSFLLTLLDTKIHTTQVKHDVLCVVISYRKFKIERNTKRVTSSQGAKNEIIGRHDVVASSWLLYPVVLLDRVRGLLELPQPADTNSNFQLKDPHSATRSHPPSPRNLSNSPFPAYQFLYTLEIKHLDEFFMILTGKWLG